MRTAKLTVLLILLSLPLTHIHAWTPATRIKMVDESMRLMPESLRLALQGRAEQVRRGALEPMVDEDGPEHQPPWIDGTLDRSVEAEARELIAALRAGRDFDEIARRFGRVAHFVFDAGFPPGMDSASGKRYTHFSSFCESRLPKFPLVFYGHDEAAEPVAYRGRAVQIMTRAREDDALLARTYEMAGDPPNPAYFDDRSVPFAVGSLAYSRIVTDVVRIWVSAWQEAGGDMGKTPYLGLEQEVKKD